MIMKKRDFDLVVIKASVLPDDVVLVSMSWIQGNFQQFFLWSQKRFIGGNLDFQLLVFAHSYFNKKKIKTVIVRDNINLCANDVLSGEGRTVVLLDLFASRGYAFSLLQDTLRRQFFVGQKEADKLSVMMVKVNFRDSCVNVIEP